MFLSASVNILHVHLHICNTIFDLLLCEILYWSIMSYDTWSIKCCIVLSVNGLLLVNTEILLFRLLIYSCSDAQTMPRIATSKIEEIFSGFKQLINTNNNPWNSSEKWAENKTTKKI